MAIELMNKKFLTPDLLQLSIRYSVPYGIDMKVSLRSVLACCRCQVEYRIGFMQGVAIAIAIKEVPLNELD